MTGTVAGMTGTVAGMTEAAGGSDGDSRRE